VRKGKIIGLCQSERRKGRSLGKLISATGYENGGRENKLLRERGTGRG